MEDWMRKSSKMLVVFLGFVLVLAMTGLAQQAQTDETVFCPVSGKTMKKSEAKASYEYKGKTYYFCCDNCKEAFLKNPEKYAQKKAGEGQMPAHEENGTVVDPICGMKMKKSDAAATYEYKGKTYYFCMEGCLEKFKKDPEKYVKNAEEIVTCPVSGEKVKKSQAAGSYEYNGKTYYFCCPNCKEKFMKDPEKYVKKKGDGETAPHGSCAACAVKKIQ